MKNLIIAFIAGAFVIACSTSIKTTSKNDLPEGAIRIANDELEYEIMIIDNGFETYLASMAKPASFYSVEYYEAKNQRYVTEWNIRFRNPQRYNTSIYENEINYDFNTNYGLDVNYKLYNYFKFVEYKYKERFF